MRIVFPLLLLFAAFPAAAQFDVNGVALGASENDVKKGFPAAYCKPLEWKSEASDRRCDDAKAALGTVPVRVTFYLNKGALQAFDVRFDSKDLDKVLPQLKARYGKPASESRDELEPKGGKARNAKAIHKVLWEQGRDRAVLVSQLDKKRSQLTVSRGNWEQEIYKVR